MKPVRLDCTVGSDRSLDWRETLRRLRVDHQRLEECCRERQISLRLLRLSPSFVCVALYRLSRYLYRRRAGLAARFVWQINLSITGADMSPISEIGEGLLVVHPVAVTVVGSAGRNFTVEGLGGMGGGLDMADIGAGPGLPVLGDNVRMARGAMVLGPVRIGTDVIIGPGCTVVRDLPDGTEVLPHVVRVRRVETAHGKPEATDVA